jgi:hypothetical protein
MPSLSSLRVAKTYAPHQPGAKRFALRHGEQLVCVRQRLNAAGTMRYTTVELLVETTPVASRARSLVALRIPPGDRATRTLLMSCGGQWQPALRYWLVSRVVARNMGLLGMVVPMHG